ncbi:hypothetical protein KFK09_016996 [Dendrobium nobile]|uniref:Uncharacterized protein n=1 Tax=Dendrobium nobile TaxID=94219 RepID=A0A8T3B134_DENNO|nr:hypothetical protein KFK09_016996 [Dendrobium nobile]
MREMKGQQPPHSSPQNCTGNRAPKPRKKPQQPRESSPAWDPKSQPYEPKRPARNRGTKGTGKPPSTENQQSPVETKGPRHGKLPSIENPKASHENPWDKGTETASQHGNPRDKLIILRRKWEEKRQDHSIMNPIYEHTLVD